MDNFIVAVEDQSFHWRRTEKCGSLQIVKTKNKREKKMHRKEKKKSLGLFLYKRRAG
jgi:hypothetical protein